jgi:hypothetical protein
MSANRRVGDQPQSGLFIWNRSLGMTLGVGTTGKVKVATHMPTGAEYAIKIFARSRSQFITR